MNQASKNGSSLCSDAFAESTKAAQGRRKRCREGGQNITRSRFVSRKVLRQHWQRHSRLVAMPSSIARRTRKWKRKRATRTGKTDKFLHKPLRSQDVLDVHSKIGALSSKLDLLYFVFVIVFVIVSVYRDSWIETDVETVQHASCNANDERNRASVVLDQLSNF